MRGHHVVIALALHLDWASHTMKDEPDESALVSFRPLRLLQRWVDSRYSTAVRLVTRKAVRAVNPDPCLITRTPIRTIAAATEGQRRKEKGSRNGGKTHGAHCYWRTHD